ncbi:MAG: hypothetical protein ACRD97_12150 [Nitrososphaeraceae archaeon]
MRSSTDKRFDERKEVTPDIWKKIERQLIDDRIRSFEPTSEPLNLSDFFYGTRTKLDGMGYNVDNLYEDRQRIHNYVKEYCDSKGIKRHEIGIFPADRAILAFRGGFESVGYHDIKRLAVNGPDVVCVEKMGIIQKIFPFMDKFGIAFLQSQGFIVEYGEMLAQESKKYGANVAVLTDFDSSGISLGFKLEGITRIGVDFDTINEINELLESESKPRIDAWKFVERYSGGGNHYTFLEYMFPERWWKELKENPTNKKRKIKPPWWETLHHFRYSTYLNKRFDDQRYIDILKGRRIELDSILSEVGPKIFSKWLRNKIIQTFPTRDYRRGVRVPSYVTTPTIQEFLKKLQAYLTSILEDKVIAHRKTLRNVNGHLIDANKKETKIKNSMSSELLNRTEILYFDAALQDFMDQHLT